MNRCFIRVGLFTVLAGSAFSSFLSPPSAVGLPNGGYARSEIIVQPEELKTLIDRKDSNVRLIDVRPLVKYLTGHIPGAVQLWRPDIEDKKHPLPGMMAPRDRIEELMGNLGVGSKSSLILYADGPDGARLWWILAYYGFPLNRMRLLDGGIDGWKAKGYPVEIVPSKPVKETFAFSEKGRRRHSLLCGLPEVKGALEDSGRVVLDVRTRKEYLGEEMKEGAVKGGRIPGVIWIEWNETLIEGGPFKGFWKGAEEIRSLFASKGVTPDKEIFMY